jgi:hypothetical protein
MARPRPPFVRWILKLRKRSSVDRYPRPDRGICQPSHLAEHGNHGRSRISPWWKRSDVDEPVDGASPTAAAGAHRGIRSRTKHGGADRPVVIPRRRTSVQLSPNIVGDPASHLSMTTGVWTPGNDGRRPDLRRPASKKRKARGEFWLPAGWSLRGVNRALDPKRYPREPHVRSQPIAFSGGEGNSSLSNKWRSH